MLRTFAVIAACCICFSAVAAPPATISAESAPAKIDPTESPRKALAKKYKEFSWKNADLSAVMRDIQTATGENFVIDWKALKAAEIDERSVVTLTARDVTIDELLELIARAANFRALGRYIVGGNIVVTTQRVALRETGPTLYDVADLIKIVPGEPNLEFRDSIQVMQVVADCVDRESWATINDTPWTAAGASPFGEMRYFRGTLFISTSARNHHKIAELLAEIRKRAEKTK